ncbi:MAG: radical SAM protein [Deltaproteobacteria bacterium]|nr:radical SAM protein [Deltaproteobacteria bacterium]
MEQVSTPTICGLVNLTVRCNQDCLFCCDGRIKDSGVHLTTEEARARIAQVRSLGAESVTFIGGEPLVRKDLAGLVAFAREQGLRVGLTSNGTLLTASKLTDLLEAGLTSIEVSVHSFDPQTADRISRRPNTAARQKAALELLADPPGGLPRPGLSLNFVIFSANFDQLPSFVRHVLRHHRFVDELFFNFVDPIGYPELDPSLVPRYREVAGPLLEALEIAREAGIPYTVDSVPGCILGTHFLFLRATREKLRGVLYAKQTWDIENPSPDPDLSQYYRTNACMECPVRGLCPGVNFRYLRLHGQGEFRPFQAALLASGRIHLPPEAPPALLDGLGRPATAHRPPITRIPITDRCNQRCPWCPCLEEGRAALSPARLTHRLESAAARTGRGRALLAGSEPALHPGFFRMLQLLAARSVQAGFVTNGRIFALPDWTRKAGQAGARFVVWRIPAPLDHLARHTGDAAAPEQSLAGMDNLLALRTLAVEAEIGVPEGSEPAVEETLRSLAGRGVFRVCLLPQVAPSPTRSASWSALAAELELDLTFRK